MTTLLLIRHAVNDHVKTGTLAGWKAGVHLNEEGQQQAAALGERLRHYPIRHIYTSPLERTVETAQAIHQHHPDIPLEENRTIGEVQYGDWQGKKISHLRGRKMWEVVQEYPSRAYFPNGETMRGAQNRIVNEIERLVQQHPSDMIALVFHADLVKMAVAHYLGVHLDNFQRIVISPASISTLQLGHSRPYVGSVNDTAHVEALKFQPKDEADSADSADSKPSVNGNSAKTVIV